MLPFLALYGRHPSPLIRYGHRGTTVDSLRQFLQERDAILDDLKANLIRTQQRMKFFADRHRKELQFDVGDWVFLKLQPNSAKRVNKKLQPNFAKRGIGARKIDSRSTSVGRFAYF